MPHRTTAMKSPTRHVQDRRAAAAAGPNSIALAPPAYGLEVVDRAPVRGQMLQTKLAVRPPGDPYEQEADRVAAQVVATLARGWEYDCTAGSRILDAAIARRWTPADGTYSPAAGVGVWHGFSWGESSYRCSG